jgi:hypothetical protein
MLGGHNFFLPLEYTLSFLICQYTHRHPPLLCPLFIGLKAEKNIYFFSSLFLTWL